MTHTGQAVYSLHKMMKKSYMYLYYGTFSCIYKRQDNQLHLQVYLEEKMYWFIYTDNSDASIQNKFMHAIFFLIH